MEMASPPTCMKSVIDWPHWLGTLLKVKSLFQKPGGRPVVAGIFALNSGFGTDSNSLPREEILLLTQRTLVIRMAMSAVSPIAGAVLGRGLDKLRHEDERDRIAAPALLGGGQPVAEGILVFAQTVLPQ